MTFLQTAEFWVAIAFIIAVVVALRLVVPKAVSSLRDEQKRIADKFDEAEQVLGRAEKKYADAKASLEGLQAEFKMLEADFDKRVSEILNTWNGDQTVLVKKKTALHQQALEHAANHMHTNFLNAFVDISCDGLEVVLKQLIKAKNHEHVLLQNLETLKLVK